MATAQPQPRVQAVHCDHMSDDAAIYACLRRATLPLQAAWTRLRAAKRIAIKFNQAWLPDEIVYHKGQLVQLVSEMWLKYVDPEEAEGEHYEVYKQALVQIVEAGCNP